jgi:hypothetical protein
MTMRCLSVFRYAPCALAAALAVLLLSPPVEAKGKMKVVFSKKPITTASPDGKGSPLVTDFKLGEPIYARVFSVDGKSINSHQSKPGSPLYFTLLYQIGDYNPRDRYRGDHHRMVLGKETKGKSYLDVDLLPNKSARQDFLTANNGGRPVGPPAGWLVNRLTAFCKDGAKVVPVDFSMGNWGKYGFKVACNDAGAATAKKLAVRASIRFVAKRRMAKPSMRNAKLAKQMARVAGGNRDRVGSGKVLRVVITKPNWTIERRAGRITGRSIRAQVALKGKDPTVCRIESVAFAQSHKGGGRYGKLHIPTTAAGSTGILCKNVKK